MVLKKKSSFSYTKKKLINGDFELTVKIDKNQNVSTELVELETKDIYTLHLTDVEGSFVGDIRQAYYEVMEKIEAECCEPDVFKSEQTLNILEYIYKTYNIEPEYLWEKFPDNAIVRRKDNSKWFGLILTVKKDKLGFDSSEKVEIIDLRAAPEDVNMLLKTAGFYPAYHMNKKNWFTIILDESVDLKTIKELIDSSYKLAVK